VPPRPGDVRNNTFIWYYETMSVRPLSPFFFLAFLVPAFAASPGVAKHRCADPPASFLERKLALWQQRLKLQDWKISIVMSRAKDLKPNTLGNVHWDAPQRKAVIRVLDAADYRLACPAMRNDMELTVVHELVHRELSSLPRSEASRSAEEHAVNRIAEALLQLDRRKK
jgi:hypothetical protein